LRRDEVFILRENFDEIKIFAQNKYFIPPQKVSAGLAVIQFQVNQAILFSVCSPLSF